MSVIVSPSLLAADFMNLGKDVEIWFTCCISNQENSP